MIRARIPGCWNDVFPGLPPYGPNAVVLDFRNDHHTWGGVPVSLDLALRCDRAQSVPALAYNRDGTWTSYSAHQVRIAEDEGLLIEVACNNRLLWPRDFSNVVWLKSNLALTDPAASPIRGESTGATRVTATAAGAYLAQNYTVLPAVDVAYTGSIVGTTMTVSAVASGRIAAYQVVLGSGVTPHTTIVQQIDGTYTGVGTYEVNFSQSVPPGTSLQTTVDRVPSLVAKAVNVTGPIYLSLDGGLSQTDIRSQLQAGKWPQIYAPYDAVLAPQWRLTFANSGDSLDIDLTQLEDRSFPTSPVPQAGVYVTRNDDVVTLNLDAFPPWVQSDKLTILEAIWPGAYNVRFGDGHPELGGFTWVDIRGRDEASPMGTATGSIALSPIIDITATSVDLGHREGLTGPGIHPESEIFFQFSGTPEGIGEYTCLPVQSFASTTFNVVAQQAYICNGAFKIDEGMSHVGCTVIDTRAKMAMGFDPQGEHVAYRQWQRVGYSTTASLKQGIMALRGNIENSKPHLSPSWADPSKFTTVTLGNQRPGANHLNGLIGVIVLIPYVQWTGEQLAAWTAASYGVP